MKNSGINNPSFREAVEAIDNGNMTALQHCWKQILN